MECAQQGRPETEARDGMDNWIGALHSGTIGMSLGFLGLWGGMDSRIGDLYSVTLGHVRASQHSGMGRTVRNSRPCSYTVQ